MQASKVSRRPATIDMERDIPSFTGKQQELFHPAALDSIRTEDRRRSGDALWVFHLEENGAVADYLKSQGFDSRWARAGGKNEG